MKNPQTKATIILSVVLVCGFSFGCKRYSESVQSANESSVNSERQIAATPSPTQTPNKQFEADAKLQSESDKLAPLFDKMPPVPVFLKDEPIIKNGTNTERGVAYTVCENKDQPTVFVKKIFYQKANQKQLTNILKHELTHAWACRQRIAAGHDARFKQKFKQVGGFGN